MLLKQTFLAALALCLPSLTIAAPAADHAAAAPASRHPTTPSSYRPLPALREQDRLERGWVKQAEDYVPEILRKYGIDAWILSQREYAEDTVFRALVPSTSVFSARRRTLYLFHTSSALPSPVKFVDNTPALWAALNASLSAVDPAQIAVNIDSGLAFSDGLHTGEGQALREGLGEEWWARVESERMLGVEVVSRRSGGEEQLGLYRSMQENVWAMMEETFSNRTITPGTTTTTDLEWHFRSLMQTLNVTTWFQPSVSLFRASTTDDPAFPGEDDHSGVIQEGDMLHVDVGILVFGMATDTQHLAYVLRANETSVPKGLADGLKKANRLQDLTVAAMSTTKTGDDVLREVRAQMGEEGLEGRIYSHPIGTYGHSAGALIGMTNLQDGVPIGGELPLLDNSWFSVELSAESFVPEWNKSISFMQEEDVAWSTEKGGWDWVYGRQERFHLVWPKAASKTLGPDGAVRMTTGSPGTQGQTVLGRWLGRWR